MKITETTLPGVLLIEPERIPDERGYFAVMHKLSEFDFEGIPPLIQTNMSSSSWNVLRGLHMQTGQGKLVQCIAGTVFDVVVDADTGNHEIFYLGSYDDKQLYIPPGFLHGFVVEGDHAIVFYSCTTYYDPSSEFTVAWNDPDIGIRWPIATPILSERDAAAGSLRELRKS